ncbi:putative transcriptional regulator [Clostridium acetobutylicum]|uniref:CBS domain containing protein n=1 Tax=Clostridium acetobutylicum (strain ATCC 824 / DSM 792 / JCM 1419 / IAM 19013 / LMG 5710 / NBRC 13948 / NRRL B-527 / VKM B-1787 / 2291 / W) TaxID=272562 RepID=Q97GB6_CLOAB|nr:MULTISPECIES: CBS domain-containing protein [Clostridium]AAK80407.1 CBS domain containing protein [Clostridium acetobutylicum ATCC 824]ADZ21504.1 CBS domain containing protein [Clostridium acetobutylicum EA 2018]AEI32350.1 CBS domain-containing protein [Clostridium acetobutylicum DSM 1731]AWV79175.1 CBS domain-containing protein [Clostridium acetobutylicum]MBC2394861.1 CBS domain-containing protein [Clostridium acetobutylicum]
MDKSIKSNAEKFIMIYNEIDRYMRKVLDENERTGNADLVKKMAKRNKVFEEYKDELMLFARLRNSIVHNPYNAELDPIAEPHDKIIVKYGELRDKILNPPLALDTIAVKGKNIYVVTQNESVLDVMTVMKDNNYANVPVVDNLGMIVGVFSKNTVFSYMVENEGVQIRRDTKINDFKEFIPLHKHENEFFAFVSRKTLAVEIEDMFKKRIHGKKKLSLVFITETGRVKEKILGIVTPWDIAIN